MPALVSSRTPRVPFRAMAATVVAIAAMTCIVLMSANHVAFAESHGIEILSASVVGPTSGGSLAPAVRVDPPKPVVVVPEVAVQAVVAADAPLVNQSTCRSDLAGAQMTITIPAISYSCSVYAGGQQMLDAGAATLITDEAIRSVLADHPGGPGVFWIAGHRSSHGGAFAAVPTLADGALITLSDGTTTATYRVVGRAYVSIRNDRVIDADGNATGAATLDSIIRADHGGNGAARLLLQTCDGENHRWMIYADLVTA
jgi:sortase (surface protein transpeptidase)